MRDTHEGMPELLAAYDRAGQLFGAVAVTLDNERRELEFGLTRAEYLALRHILNSRPFDQLPGIRYRYFVADSVSRTPGEALCQLDIRIEQDRTARQFPFELPLSLATTLLWFARLKSFAPTSHLRAPEPAPRNA